MPYVTGEVASVIRIIGKLWKAWAKVLEIAKVTFESRDKTLLEFSDMRVMEREILCARRLLPQCQDTAFLLAHELPSVLISVISRKKKKNLPLPGNIQKLGGHLRIPARRAV